MRCWENLSVLIQLRLGFYRTNRTRWLAEEIEMIPFLRLWSEADTSRKVTQQWTFMKEFQKTVLLLIFLLALWFLIKNDKRLGKSLKYIHYEQSIPSGRDCWKWMWSWGSLNSVLVVYGVIGRIHQWYFLSIYVYFVLCFQIWFEIFDEIDLFICLKMKVKKFWENSSCFCWSASLTIFL